MSELEDMTHEELAAHALHEGRITGSGDLVDAARELQNAVDEERDSVDQAESVIAILRA